MSRPTFIVDALRSAVAKGKPDGTISRNFHPVDLLASVLGRLGGAKSATVGEHVQDVIAGCVTPIAQQGANVGRLSALKAFSINVPGVQINRMCGSGQQAVHFASQAIAAGDMDVAIGCGVELMGTVQMGSDTDLFSPEPSEFKSNFPYKLIHQGVSAEQLAAKYGISREECDQWAIRSHTRAQAAIDAGHFKQQIVPLDLPKDGGQLLVDEGVRFPVDEERLRSLATIFTKDKTSGVVTAGNASQISDGAAGVLVASEAGCSALGLEPRARIVARTVVGSDPVIMLDGIIPATHKVLADAGLTMDDIDLFEVNEAFACVVLAWIKECKVDAERVNVNGGAVAHGHPLGATGGVLMSKLVHELERTGGRYGLQTMCIGHGMATATIIERV